MSIFVDKGRFSHVITEHALSYPQVGDRFTFNYNSKMLGILDIINGNLVMLEDTVYDFGTNLSQFNSKLWVIPSWNFKEIARIHFNAIEYNDMYNCQYLVNNILKEKNVTLVLEPGYDIFPGEQDYKILTTLGNNYDKNRVLDAIRELEIDAHWLDSYELLIKNKEQYTLLKMIVGDNHIGNIKEELTNGVKTLLEQKINYIEYA